MQYFKKSQLATNYNVSESAVRHWIEAAKSGKLKLILHEQDGRFYIANTTENRLLMEELATRGQKYRNSRYHRKTLRPTKEFYELYNPKQVLDIMSNLDIHREIPLQYSYFDGGADYWDHYAQKLINEPARNMLTGSIELFDLNHPYIDWLAQEANRVNVVDLGPGNALPVKALLERLLQKEKLGRYIGIDLSKAMLTVAQQNLNSWFQTKIPTEWHSRDITDDRFNDLLIEEHFGGEADSTRDLVLLLGGTLTNLRSPAEALHTIRKSMGKNDILLYSMKLDTPNSRQYFDFGIKDSDILAPNHRLILDLLNVDSTNYEVEKFFDEEKTARFIQIRLKNDIALEFEVGQNVRPILFNKGEKITVWRYWHQDAFSVQQQFDENGFDVLQMSKTEDHEYMLLIAAIKTAT